MRDFMVNEKEIMQRTRSLLGEEITLASAFFTPHFSTEGGFMEDLRKILRSSSADADISSDQQLCEQSGINYSTLRHRFRNPGSLRLFELGALNDVLNMSDETLLRIIKIAIN